MRSARSSHLHYMMYVFIFAGTDLKAESWSWAQYLDEQKATAAPAKLFQEVENCNRNNRKGIKNEIHQCDADSALFHGFMDFLSIT